MHLNPKNGFTSIRGVPPSRHTAFTLVELMVVIVVTALAALTVLPALSTARAKSQRIRCVSCLKQIGLAFRVFSTDHGDRYPQQLTASNLTSATSVTWEANLYGSLSNELSTPYILVCPSDTRRPATNWTRFGPRNLSYFVGLEAQETSPQTLLAGDRNLETNGWPVGSGLVVLTTNTAVGWTAEIHKRSGNLALGDGSVQQATASRLAEQIRLSGLPQQTLVVP